MRDFYATTAQVIPVLLLAFVFEGRYLETVQRERGPVRTARRWLLRIALAAAILGEVFSLIVLSHPGQVGWPGTGFVLLCVIYLLAALGASISELADRQQ